MSLLIKNWSEADWKELLKWAKIGANNAMIGEFAEVEELPPHGRLIDADAVYKRLQKQAMSVWGDGNPRYQIILDVMDAIRFAPTIIPAEEGE